MCEKKKYYLGYNVFIKAIHEDIKKEKKNKKTVY